MVPVWIATSLWLAVFYRLLAMPAWSYVFIGGTMLGRSSLCSGKQKSITNRFEPRRRELEALRAKLAVEGKRFVSKCPISIAASRQTTFPSKLSLESLPSVNSMITRRPPSPLASITFTGAFNRKLPGLLKGPPN